MKQTIFHENTNEERVELFFAEESSKVNGTRRPREDWLTTQSKPRLTSSIGLLSRVCSVKWKVLVWPLERSQVYCRPRGSVHWISSSLQPSRRWRASRAVKVRFIPFVYTHPTNPLGHHLWRCRLTRMNLVLYITIQLRVQLQIIYW